MLLWFCALTRWGKGDTCQSKATRVSPFGLFCHLRQSRDCGGSVTSPPKFVLPLLACAGSRGFGSAADQAGNGAERRLQVESSGIVTTCTQSGLRSCPLSPPSDEPGALAKDSRIRLARQLEQGAGLLNFAALSTGVCDIAGEAHGLDLTLMRNERAYFYV